MNATNKNLNLLLSGQLVSQVGDKFYLLALSFWVLTTTKSPALMGLVLACSLIPSLLLGFVSGAFVDRYDRKTIIVMTDIVRGLIIGFVALAYLSGFLNVAVLVISQILLSINAAFFDPAVPAVIPRIVAKDQLTKANSKTEFIRGMSTIAGPVLGGLAVAAFGYGFAFIFNSVSFLVSAFFESFMKIPPVERTAGEKQTIRRDIAAGYRYIMGNRGFVIILLMVAVIHFFVGSIEVVIPVLADSLNGDGARNLGYIQASLGVGAVVMAMIISIFSIDNKEGLLLFSSVFFIGLAYTAASILVLSGAAGVLPFLFLFFVIGSLLILAGTCFKSILMKQTDDGMAGRVFGVVGSVGNGSIPLAMLVYGFLLTRLNLSNLVLVSGLLLLPLSIISYKQWAPKRPRGA